MVVINVIKTFLTNLALKFKTWLNTNHAIHWNQEDNQETSKHQYHLLKFHAASILAVLIKLDAANYSKEELLLKYDYARIKHCLGCVGISFDKILEDIFDVGEITEGIEAMGIECNFEVEPNELSEKLCLCCSTASSSCINISIYLNLNSCKLKDGESC